MEIFHIIKHRGQANRATLVNGSVVHRQEKIYVPEYRGWVKCAPYDNHFVFEVPQDIAGPAHQCTCGSIAHIIGSKDYGHLGSPEGMLFTCLHHTSTNKHADGST